MFVPLLLLPTAAAGLALQPPSAARLASVVRCSRSPPPRLQAPYFSNKKDAAKQQLGRVGEMRQKLAQTTLARVAVPTLLSTLVAYVYFDNLSLLIAADLENGTIRLVARDEARCDVSKRRLLPLAASDARRGVRTSPEHARRDAVVAVENGK